MQNFKRLLVIVIALVLAASVVFFTLENRTPIQLVFFGWLTPELPIALFVMSAFVLGLILGPLISWWPHQRLRMRYSKQAKQLKACEQRIKVLQTSEESETEAQAPALPTAGAPSKVS
ncbi:LapA family protein [Denitrificimonas sp. JX-1]|uniref:LapA family protein n=1 Tax=Denitrificimonas halotolerans TaxID=3098930 RepID=A0ABU5GRM6_9GAMM|nr:LapA family protein [Denitrificimonas sp. JX-1]MDY7219182.1 LapA family protein [Denitrificimonas sp. JX-1]